MSAAKPKCQKQKQDVVTGLLALLACQQNSWPTGLPGRKCQQQNQNVKDKHKMVEQCMAE